MTVNEFIKELQKWIKLYDLEFIKCNGDILFFSATEK